MKTGVIDVGGGLRGSFGCGVLDRCLDDGAAIDYGIGVSAGSANILSFFAGQKGRNFTYYTEYAFRREYLSFRNMVRKHNYLDLDYVYSTLSDSDGEYPLDYRSAKASGKEYYAVACDAVTGKPRYFTFGDGLEQDRYDALKASCCVPIACQPYRIDGVPYVDGGLADLSLQQFANRTIHTLSGGEFQKVRRARALAQTPKFLLLDEPAANLDYVFEPHLMQLLSDTAHSKNIGILAAVHDINLAARYADKIILLPPARTSANSETSASTETSASSKKSVLYGSPSDIMNIDNLKYTFGVDFECKEIKSFQSLQ